MGSPVDLLSGLTDNIIGEYTNIPAKIWVLFTSLRIFLTLQIVMDAYENENSFICDSNDGSPGCQNQCYMRYAPISLSSFWIISLTVLLIPFLLFNKLIEWMRIEWKQIDEDEDIPQTWISRQILSHTTLERKERNGIETEIPWNPAIYICLVMKLIVVLAIELGIVKVFIQLQCAKFNIASNNCHAGRLLQDFPKFLTIPEGYRCYIEDFSDQTYFGFARSQTTLCHTTATKTTCWIPAAVEKSYLIRILLFLTVMAIVSISLELLLTITKIIIRVYSSKNCSLKDSYTKDFDFDRKNNLREHIPVTSNILEPPLYLEPPF